MFYLFIFLLQEAEQQNSENQAMIVIGLSMIGLLIILYLVSGKVIEFADYFGQGIFSGQAKIVNKFHQAGGLYEHPGLVFDPLGIRPPIPQYLFISKTWELAVSMQYWHPRNDRKLTVEKTFEVEENFFGSVSVEQVIWVHYQEGKFSGERRIVAIPTQNI